MIRNTQLAFGGGELSPAMYGRVDDNKYQQGLSLCRNFICSPQGALRTRPGFAFVRPAKYADKVCRLLPFQFSPTQTMVIELGDKYARFHTEGATLMNGDVPYEITTPYAAEDVMDIHYCQSADIITLVHPKYAPRELRRYNLLDWRLQTIDFTAGTTAPKMGTVTYTCGIPDNKVSDYGYDKQRYTIRYRVTAVTTTEDGDSESPASEVGTVKGNLYIDDSTCTINWSAVEGADRYRVYKSYTGVYGYIGETDSTSFIDNNIAADESVTPPRYDNIFNQPGGITKVTVTNGGSGYASWGKIQSVDLNGFAFSVTKASSSSGARYPIVTAKIIDKQGSGSGAKVSVITTNDYTWADIGGESSVTEYYSTTYMVGVVLVSGGQEYKEPALRFEVSYDGKKYSTSVVPKDSKIDSKVKIKVGANNSVQLAITDSAGRGAVLTPRVKDGVIESVSVDYPGIDYVNPTITAIDTGEGKGATFTCEVSKAGDYPGAVGYFEQRRFFAGTPNLPQMVWATRPGTERDMSYTLPAKADNRLKFRIAASQASRINHLVPIQQLLALTESTVFRINDEVAADNVSVKPQTSEGASDVQPVVVNSTVVYTAARGGHAYELGYQYQKGGVVAADLAIRAGHLFETARPVDLTKMTNPDPILWFAHGDGKLLGLTYMPDQNVGAWHQHVTEGGSFESVACVTEGDEDRLYAVVRRLINGNVVRYIERMGPKQYGDTENAFCVDCGVTYEGEEVSSIRGLDHLEGETVNILADGGVMPSQVVTEGRIELSRPAKHVHIGIPITADMSTLPMALSLQDGSYGRGHSININKVWLQVYQSSGIWVGPTFEKLTEFKQRTDEPFGTPPTPVTGQVSVLTTPSWRDQGQVWVRQTDPLPLTITGLCSEVAS